MASGGKPQDPRRRWDETILGINPAIQAHSPASKIIGPFDVLEYASLQPIAMLPWRDVKGANMLVGVGEAAIATSDNNFAGSLVAEVEIRGHVQGVPSVLKRGVATVFTGPLAYRFTTWDLYDNIIISVRNMSSGVGGPHFGNTTLAGALMRVTITLQPEVVRGGPYA